jgi:single-strand DNA-binding protein
MLFNQWTGVGRLGRDPDMSYTNTGKAVTKFSIAVDQGQDKDTMWLNVTCWEKVAERANEKLMKGNEVFIQGRLMMRSYEDKAGIKRTLFEISATSVQLTQYSNKSDVPVVTPTHDELGDLDDHPF